MKHLWLLGMLCCWSQWAGASALELPRLLADWQAWVLEDQPQRQCPWVQPDGSRQCLWISQLEVDAQEKGATFTLSLEAFAPSWVTLPGGQGQWPQEVMRGGEPAPVRDQKGEAQIYVPAGSHQISGRFSWASLPSTLRVPPEVALVQLRLSGQPVAHPTFEGEGELWLAAKDPEASSQADSLNIKVFRKLSDGVPVRIKSRLELDVSGKARELTLGPWLLPGFQVQALSSDLPARLDEQGFLRVQLKPGSWVIALDAYSLAPLPNLALPAASADWPDQEIWVFEAANALRSLNLTGAPSIDPSQTALPEDWQRLPAYLVTAQAPVQLQELFRGNPNPPKDELQLNRSLWLDFSGEGFTFSDRLAGRLSQSARVDMAEPYLLGSAKVREDAQIITRLAPQQAGLELREETLDLTAAGRLLRQASVPVSGWMLAFDAVRWDLYLPPGWSLFHAAGVDRATNTWVGQWGLWDIFLVTLLVIALSKLTRLWIGALALASLLLTYHRDGAPVFAWLNLTLALVLANLASGQLAAWLRRYAGLSLVWLVVVLLAFTLTQVRAGLYPQLAEHWAGLAQGAGLGAEGNTSEEAQPTAAAAPMMLERFADELPASASYSRMKAAPVVAPPRYAVQQQTQTGPGVPQWRQGGSQLHWRGPVSVQQTTHLWLVPPWLNRLTSLVAAGLPWLLLWALWRQFGGHWPRPAAAQLPVISGLLLLALLSPSPDSYALAPQAEPPRQSVSQAASPQAQTADSLAGAPSQALLDELKQRLTRPPLCLPDCASLEALSLTAKGDSLRLELRLNALTPIALNLPANRSGWWPSLAVLNGKRASLRQADDGQLQVALPPGRHSLLLQGDLTGRNNLTLPFGLPIRYLQSQLDGWRLSGEPTDTDSSDSLQLTRTQPASVLSDNRLAPAPAAPFVQVTRRLVLGLEWQLETQVQRLAPVSGPIHMAIPLWPGEAPLSRQANAEGLMQVSLGPDDQSLSWSSRLPVSTHLQVSAPAASPWVEIWQLDAAAQWHWQAEGLPPLGPVMRPYWQPWPGERLLLNLSKPEAVAGNSMTLQKVVWDQTLAPKLQAVELQIQLVSNRASDYPLQLPAGASLTDVRVNEQTLPLAHQDGAIKIPVRPGEQLLQVRWQQAEALAWHHQTPALDLGQPASNIHLNLQIPEDRWILWLSGPQLGPVLLFWGMLLVVLALALALGRSRATPLKAYEWCLLSLGAMTQNGLALLLLAAWFLAMNWRGRGPVLRDLTRFRALQVALALLTLAALGTLLATVPMGLLAQPSMYIAPPSGYALRWYSDATAGLLPQASVFSAPLWVYRLAMLLWSLWLAFSLVRWVQWGWQQWSQGGLWGLTAPPTPGGDRPQEHQPGGG
jgi:hypothetical protein